MNETSSPTLEPVRDPARAAVLLTPLRLEILGRAREPRSATEIAGQLGLPRQRVNYHVKELARARFLRKASRVRRRNFYEQRYRASAGSYLLAPELLGPVAAGLAQPEDRASAAFLLAATARLQGEVCRAAERAAAEGKRLATLTLDADLRFESAGQRDRFTRALRDAVAGVIAEHSSPAVTAGGEAGAGRPYRLVLGCHPVIEDDDGDERGKENG